MEFVGSHITGAFYRDDRLVAATKVTTYGIAFIYKVQGEIRSGRLADLRQVEEFLVRQRLEPFDCLVAVCAMDCRTCPAKAILN